MMDGIFAGACRSIRVAVLLAVMMIPNVVQSDPLTPPPLPLLPIPSSSQLQWQLGEMSLFLHFGLNTFTDSEWGSGHSDPSIFNPTRLDASQWIKVAEDSGFSSVILTAKHHDGFCLWPSIYTNYSVRSSFWKRGHGDVVGELAAAARKAGIGFGLYLSPWDRHEPSYGKPQDYNEFYLAQMSELLTRYGEIKEFWLDGAKGEGEKDMIYLFDSWFNVVHQLQHDAVIFSDAGPDVRWVGDETGAAGTTCWSLLNQSDVTIGDADLEYLRTGEMLGRDWIPPECDVSIRTGWFWHEKQKPKSPEALLDIFYRSVGRNCHLLLNIPPNSSGLISEDDVEVLRQFTKMRTSIFDRNLAENSTVTASSTRGTDGDDGDDDGRFTGYNIRKRGIDSYWAPKSGQSDWVLQIDLGKSVKFNVLQVQEPIQMGQRIIEFHLEMESGGRWHHVVNGTTVGYRRVLLFHSIECRRLQFVITGSRADPLISYLAIHMDPFSNLQFHRITPHEEFVNEI